MNKKNRVRFWLLTGFLILFGGMTTYAMEIGGFDVEIGAGESAAYPDGWWDTPSCGDTEENAPDSLISGEAFAEASFDALEELESGSEADFTAEQGVKQEILKQQETLEQQAGPDSAVQEPAIQNREADEAMAVTESENTPAPSLMPSSTKNLFPGPAIAAHPANTITPVPEAEKGVPLSEAGLSEGVFPVSALQRILAGSTKDKIRNDVLERYNQCHGLSSIIGSNRGRVSYPVVSGERSGMPLSLGKGPHHFGTGAWEYGKCHRIDRTL